MSNVLNQQQLDLAEQLKELVKVGVGGKFKDTTDYTAKIQEELEFEEAMLQGGIDRFNKTIKEAIAKGQESTTLHGLVLQQKYITKLSLLIHGDIKIMETGGAGNRLTAMKLLCQCLPEMAFKDKKLKEEVNIWDTCSLIVLKNVIDGISNETTMNKLAIKIGTGLMMEARITMFKDQNKDKYNQVNKRLADKNIPQGKHRYNYKSKVWVYMMNKNDLVFNDWGKEGRLHLGVKMIEYLSKLGLIKHQNRKLNKFKTITYVEATRKIIDEIRNFNIKNEALQPKYLPMLMPPRKWEYNPFVGGYYGRKHNYENKAENIREIK